MNHSKGIIANHVETPIEKVETPNRLVALILKYPTKKEDFKQFFRDNGIGDWSFYNLTVGRSKFRPTHGKLIERMVRSFDLTEK